MARKKVKEESVENAQDRVSGAGAEEARKISAFAKPSWVKLKPNEMEKIIVELAEQGESPARIGLILRDKYGVPKAKIFGKKISEILKEKGVKYKTEGDIINMRVKKLKEHIEKNKHDYGAKRALTKKLWAVYSYEKRGY